MNNLTSELENHRRRSNEEFLDQHSTSSKRSRVEIDFKRHQNPNEDCTNQRATSQNKISGRSINTKAGHSIEWSNENCPTQRVISSCQPQILKKPSDTKVNQNHDRGLSEANSTQRAISRGNTTKKCNKVSQNLELCSNEDCPCQRVVSLYQSEVSKKSGNSRAVQNLWDEECTSLRAVSQRQVVTVLSKFESRSRKTNSKIYGDKFPLAVASSESFSGGKKEIVAGIKNNVFGMSSVYDFAKTYKDTSEQNDWKDGTLDFQSGSYSSTHHEEDARKSGPWCERDAVKTNKRFWEDNVKNALSFSVEYLSMLLQMIKDKYRSYWEIDDELENGVRMFTNCKLRRHF